MKRSTFALAAACATALIGAVSASPAGADFQIRSFGGSATDNSGARLAQAGAHPDISTTIKFKSHVATDGDVLPDENVRDLAVSLPVGLIGNPLATARCASTLLEGDGSSRAQCPAESQVGRARIQTVEDTDTFDVAIYNIDPPPGVTARFGFNVADTVITIDAKLRTFPEVSVVATSRGTSQTLPVYGVRITLWGDPADSSHDFERKECLEFGVTGPCRATAPPVPFITSPTACSGLPLRTSVSANSWQNPGVFRTASFDTDFDGFPLSNEGCGRLTFEPVVTTKTSNSAPDAPTALDVDLESPQNLANADGLATAQLRDVTMTLPDGLTINPGAADGLQACSDAQLNLENEGPASCPGASKLGTVSAVTPVLANPVNGEVYLRPQGSNDPESGEMFRVALVLRDKERGVLIKLPGSLKVNEATGRITASFTKNPQVPVEAVHLSLKSGPRAPLATPASCGAKTIDTNLVSWAGQDLTRSTTFGVDCVAGLGGFAPAFDAGSVQPDAGAFAAFSASITKRDGDTALSGLSMVLPAGLVAQLKGNVGTQVGSVEAYAGPGSNPFALPGQVYLEGPYGGAPFSLKVVVPAKAGPFDLGEVVVRQRIFVDPITAQVTVVSDPLPTIVKGVPVRLQRLDVSVDKPDFIINPTSCAAKTISGTLSSAAGQSVPVTNRFQVGECASLDLRPDLALSLSGKGQTTDGKHPAVTADVTQARGQANLKKVRVALPLSLALDPDNANGLCEFVDGSKAEPTCPKASIVGTATATTPILNEPLSGPVYFVKNIRKNPRTGKDIKTLPKLVIPLTGENGIKLTLTGTSDVEDNHLVTTFDNIPDAPVSSFKLAINGGKGGILAVSGTDICKSTQIADQQVDGQNNKAADASVYIQTPSCLVKVISKSVGKTTVKLKVGGLGAGKVTVSGKGIKKTTKSIAKSTVATITVRRTKARLGSVKVSFVAKGAKKAKSATATLR